MSGLVRVQSRVGRCLRGYFPWRKCRAGCTVVQRHLVVAPWTGTGGNTTGPVVDCGNTRNRWAAGEGASRRVRCLQLSSRPADYSPAWGGGRAALSGQLALLPSGCLPASGEPGGGWREEKLQGWACIFDTSARPCSALLGQRGLSVCTRF